MDIFALKNPYYGNDISNEMGFLLECSNVSSITPHIKLNVIFN